MSQLFTSGGQSIGVSASTSVLPRTDLLQNGLVESPCSPKDSQESSPTPQFKSISSSMPSFLYGPTLRFVHEYREKTALTRWTFVGKVMSLLFNMLSRLIIAFLPGSKHLLLSFMAAVTICSDFGAQENSLLLFPLFLHQFAMKSLDQMP